MPNVSNNAYGLTLVCPIKNGALNYQSYASITRQHLQTLETHQNSPLAKVPNTFFARFYILNDVLYQGGNSNEDHLKSKYLVFSSNFHGALEDYLKGFWGHAKDEVALIWQHCVAFEGVNSCSSFIDYVKKCQIETNYYFNGSTGAPLDEQLKALYLKQEFSEFVIKNQGCSPTYLQKAFRAFIERTKPFRNDGPTWAPGKHSL